MTCTPFRAVLFLVASCLTVRAAAPGGPLMIQGAADKYRLAANGVGCGNLDGILDANFTLFQDGKPSVTGADEAKRRCNEARHEIITFEDMSLTSTDAEAVETGRFEARTVGGATGVVAGRYILKFRKDGEKYVLAGDERISDRAPVAPYSPPWFLTPVIQGGTTGTLAIIGILLTALFARNSWRLSYFTEAWFGTVEFLKANAKYMDAQRNVNYKTEFTGVEAIEYELVARRCIAFIDDMYYLGYDEQLDVWYRGTIKLFAGRHEAWLKDNETSYGEDFFRFVEERI